MWSCVEATNSWATKSSSLVDAPVTPKRLVASAIRTPSELLPEMRFLAATDVPPIVLFCEAMIWMPPAELPRARVPVMSVPMRFPWTTFAYVPGSEIQTP